MLVKEEGKVQVKHFDAERHWLRGSLEALILKRKLSYIRFTHVVFFFFFIFLFFLCTVPLFSSDFHLSTFFNDFSGSQGVPGQSSTPFETGRSSWPPVRDHSWQ